MAEAVTSFAEARARVTAYLGGDEMSANGAEDAAGWLVAYPPEPGLILNEPTYLVDRAGQVQPVHMNDIDQDTYERILAMSPVTLS